VYEKVKSLFPEVVNEAEKKGIEVEEIVKRLCEKYSPRYKEKTILTKIRAELRNRIRIADAKKVKVVIAGSRDRYGKNYPIRIAGLRPDGKHVEISSWSYDSVKYKNSTVELPVPSIATVAVIENEEYGSLNLIEIVDYKMLRRKELMAFLEKVAVKPSELSKNDEKRVVVIKGTIRGVYPATNFVDGEPSGDLPVLSEDQRDKPNLHPTMQIWLEADGETRTRLVLERPRYSKPFYDITDFKLLCEDARNSMESHLEQCEYVQSGIEGDQVYAVGIVTRYHKDRDAQGNPVNYVDIGVSAIYEIAEESNETEESSGSTESETIDLSGEEWKLQFINRLDEDFLKFKAKVEKKGKIIKLPMSIQEYDSDGFRVYTGVYETRSGSVIVGLKYRGDELYSKCSCGKEECVHLMGLWSYARTAIMKEYMDGQKIPDTKKTKLFHEEDVEDSRSDSKIAKLESLVRAYMRAVDLPASDLTEGVIYEKMGIKEKEYPKAVVESVIEKVRANE